MGAGAKTRLASRIKVSTPQCVCRLVKDISRKEFKAELAKEEHQSTSTFRRAHCILQRLPHILPHKFRVELLRDACLRDKARVTNEAGPYAQNPYVTVRRTHLLTDGFREMSRLPVRQSQLLDLGRAPYVLYGVKYIDLVSLADDVG